jgi:hypothetical protein
VQGRVAVLPLRHRVVELAAELLEQAHDPVGALLDQHETGQLALQVRMPIPGLA